MTSLALVSAGTWTQNVAGLNSHIARWGESLVNYYRTAVHPNYGTTYADTGVGAAFSTITTSGSVFTDALYTQPGQGDDTYLYLCQDDNVDLFRVSTAGSLTDLGNRTGGAGSWQAVHGGHPSLIVATHSQSPGSRITTYPKPTGGTGTDIVTSAATLMFETLEVDLATGLIYVSTFVSGVSRGVRRYQDDGTLDWDVTIPNAAADGVRTVNGLAKLPMGLVAYTVDIDEPGGTRVNNNWWLLDDSGNVELLDVTVDGVDFATWADTGSNEMIGMRGCLSVLNGRVYTQGPGGVVYGSVAVQGLKVGFLRMTPT